jgi:hypothetical protein
MSLRSRLARTVAELRSFLDLPTPLDEDQDDYWTALPQESAGRPRPPAA